MILPHQLETISSAMGDLETEVFGEVHLLDEYDTDELVHAWQALTDIVASIYRAKSTLDGELIDRLDVPRVLDDGRVMNPKATKKQKGWRKPELLDELHRRFDVHAVDPETGQRVVALSPEVLKYMDVATGRRRAWTEIGVELDNFCETEWETKLEVKKL